MGSKKTTTVQNNDPWGPAQPYILKGLEQTGRVFDANQPSLDKYAAESFGTYGRMAPGAEAGITGAQKYTNDMLAGKYQGKSPGTSLLTDTMEGDYLQGNPYLQGMIDQTGQSVKDRVTGLFSGSGQYGSSAHQGVLAKQLAEAENAMRFNNYGMERQNQLAAADGLNQLYAADLDRISGAADTAQNLMAGSQGLLNQTAELPWIGVQALNGGVRQASGGYGTSTTKSKTSGGALGSIAGLGMMGLGAAGGLGWSPLK